MNVETLIAELKKADPHDEVILIVEELDEPMHELLHKQVLRGISSNVIRSGEGARVGQCEIYAKG